MAMRMRLLAGLLTMLGCLVVHPASATDGVREINQACVATGCFPGDTPGFPVQLTSEGAYRLTSNLVVSVGAVGGVYVGSKVDLDLNGFVIRGPGTCSGSGGSVSCVGLAGYGVVVDNAGPSSVRNGMITGAVTGLDVASVLPLAVSDLVIDGAATGILGRPGSISMERVRVEQTSGSCMFFIFGAPSVPPVVDIRSSLVRNCHDSGIALEPAYRLSVRETEVVGVGVLGIQAGEGASIRDVRVGLATTDGVVCGDGCLVEGTQVRGNGGRGIVAGGSSSIVENEVGSNGSTAIIAGQGSTISRNTVNASDITGNHHGIQCLDGCGAFENVVRSAKIPISLGSDSRASRNVMSLYESPPSLGVSAGDNLCSGTNC